ncbi:OmpA family protein [Neolewinella persica]|uniref:OmpA family protein n=1 Tax=Neolewinella persica TaxID=70998 RepID=UPI0003673A9C|nr:OmpA family protein [Neolewinella persica]
MLRHAAISSLILLFCFAFTGLEAQQLISLQGANAPAEIDPLLRPDGQELFFTRPNFASNKGTDNAADIWTMPRYADGSWGRPLNPGSPINSFAHDRALAFSPDGNRLAVLRTGAVSYLDVLEKSGRNWRILDSWPLPEGIAPRYDVTFDPNALQLIYSAYDGGNLDLYRRDALPNGTWGASKELLEANGPGNETSPTLATDGRTMYFRRDGGRWFRQDIPGVRPVSVDIPTNVRQFSASLSSAEIIAALPATSSKKEQLVLLPVEIKDLPVPVTLERGYLSGPPPPGSQTARVALTDGLLLTVYPDALNRYAVFLRRGETWAIDRSLPPLVDHGQRQGNLVATTAPDVYGTPDRQQIQAGITRRQRELDLLDAERRKYDLVAPKTGDPELAALRDQYQRSTMSPTDTIPPSATTAKSKGRSKRYAEELAELERMKAKFRRQQNEKLGQRSDSNHKWTKKTATPAPAAVEIPSIGESYRPPSPVVRTQAELEQAYNDSLRIAAEIRAGLKRDNTPRIYERASWENEVREGLPRTEPLSPAEIARLDSDYQRQLDELEALRAQLRRLDATPTSPQPTTYGQPATTNRPAAAQTWEAKGTPSPNQPAKAPSPYARPATPEEYNARPPASLTTREVTSPTTATNSLPSGRGAPMPAGISFIPNTAYPDSRGYTGLDQLVGLIQQSTSVLEIRVHTPANLDPRAAQLLSEERATTIRNFLANKGIAPNNYQAIGFGNNLTGEQGERVEVLR